MLRRAAAPGAPLTALVALLLAAVARAGEEGGGGAVRLDIGRPPNDPLAAQAAGGRRDSEHVYWNSVTGDVQEENPGGVPFEMADGTKYWMHPGTARVSQADPEAGDYVWVEKWSQQQRRNFYLNQETGESSWDRPVDLAWRLVRRSSLEYDPYAEL
eukprot:jgi/Tetstr1/441621/TSEL_029848.t1